MIIPPNYPYIRNLLWDNNYDLTINPGNILIWKMDNPRIAFMADLSGISIRKENDFCNFPRATIASIQFSNQGISQKIQLHQVDNPPFNILELGNSFRPFTKEDGKALSLFLADIFNDQLQLV